MKVILLLAVLVAGAMAAPAKLDGLDHHHHHDHDSSHDHHSHHPNDPLAALAASAQTFSGYNYEPPLVPSGLYELPSEKIEITTKPTTTTSTTTTTTTTTTPAPPSNSYLPPPDNKPEPNEPIPAIVPNGTVTTMMPMPYNIEWGVSDLDSGNIFNHVEDSDGKDVTGEYSVLLPDNRMQIVRFKVDPINGYQAEVTYVPMQ